MGFVQEGRKAFGHALSSVHAGVERLVSRKLGTERVRRIAVMSPELSQRGPLPVSCTASGVGAPPALEWGDAPEETRSFVLVCEDPDAPLPDPFVHWIVYGIPRDARSIDARSVSKMSQGKNSKLQTGFTPAAPPAGHGVHHYHFQLFALDAEMPADHALGRGALVDAMRGHVVGFGELIGTAEHR